LDFDLEEEAGCSRPLLKMSVTIFNHASRLATYVFNLFHEIPRISQSWRRRVGW
jgi:hypothetical protein